MKKLDAFEQDIQAAYERGELKYTSPSKTDLAKFKAATATFIKDRRINIGHSSVAGGAEHRRQARLVNSASFVNVYLQSMPVDVTAETAL
jgi:hypothetical protein